MKLGTEFEPWFQKATGNMPFPYQKRFAIGDRLPELVDVPTGLGKTAMAVLGWLWRRRYHPDEAIRKSTPRRLLYCLPMRVLVEQTRDNAVLWLANLECLAGNAEFDEQDSRKKLRSYKPDFSDPKKKKVPVHVLMGGEDEEDWDIHPEREQIIVGTQDMLLSRALNRGYAASRSRWPMQFGILHTDSLWIFDEIQLMGAGLATTTQLEAFRRILGNKNGHGCRSVWMSATMHKDWLATVDFSDFLKNGPELAFDFEEETAADGLDEKTRKNLEDRWNAKKPLKRAQKTMDDIEGLAKEILEVHKAGTRTIIVVNTVKRACELFKTLHDTGDSPRKGKSRKGQNAVQNAGILASPKPEIILLHSRFRPGDRKDVMERAIKDPPPEGMIVVTTQVIEAGVDVSATTLFTELAPWSSLVQRFGRCNRRGEANTLAGVRWIDVPDKDAAPYAPYYKEDVEEARRHLKEIVEKLEEERNVGLRLLPDVELKFEHTHAIRRKDLIDLFDTTPDLAGNDIDIDRFVREVEESDVRVFWRTWEQSRGNEPPRDDGPAPRRVELCPVPIGSDGFRKFADDPRRKGKVWRWNFLEKNWEPAASATIAPGQVFLVHADAGGYSPDRGWAPNEHGPVSRIPVATQGDVSDAFGGDRLVCVGVWKTIAEHSEEVCSELDAILKDLSLMQYEVDALSHAACWHDRGKAHMVFQYALPEGDRKAGELYAKSNGSLKRYERRHFRHELASALAVLDPRNDKIPDEVRNLVAYLVAAHHGKVRLSIRSFPNETRPDGGRRFARGVWDGDPLPATDLGDGVIAPAVALSLEPMELGLCEDAPFKGQPSWADRMIRLRDEISPFRLAYLEAILRAADRRASQRKEIL